MNSIILFDLLNLIWYQFSSYSFYRTHPDSSGFLVIIFLKICSHSSLQLNVLHWSCYCSSKTIRLNSFEPTLHINFRHSFWTIGDSYGFLGFFFSKPRGIDKDSYRDPRRFFSKILEDKLQVFFYQESFLPLWWFELPLKSQISGILKDSQRSSTILKDFRAFLIVLKNLIGFSFLTFLRILRLFSEE